MGDAPRQSSLDPSSQPFFLAPLSHESQQSSILPSHSTILLDEEPLSPWQPPEPMPFDPLQPWGPSRSMLSVAAQSGTLFRKSASTGVFERLTVDTNRRTTVKQRLAELREKQEEVVPRKGKKVEKERVEEVYRRLNRDSEIRQEAAKRSSVEPAEKAESQKLTSPRQVDLLNRLASDARRRADLQVKQQQEIEEKAMEDALRLANMHHPTRPRDPTIQQRLQTQRLTPPPEPAPAPKKVFTQEESKQVGLRLMQAGHSPTQVVQIETEKITPKQAEELVNRLYAGRKKASATPRPVAFQAGPSPSLVRASVTSHPRKQTLDTLEQLLAEAEHTVRSQSPRDSLSMLEDLDDMLLRIKTKAVPSDSALHRPGLQLRHPQSNSAEPQVPSLSQQPSMNFPLKPKSDLFDQDLESPKVEMSRSVHKPQARVRRQGDSLTKPPRVSPRLVLEEARVRPNLLVPGRMSLDFRKDGRSSYSSTQEGVHHYRFVTSFDEAE